MLSFHIKTKLYFVFSIIRHDKFISNLSKVINTFGQALIYLTTHMIQQEPFPGLRVEAPALPGKMLVVRQLDDQFSRPAPGGFLHTWWVHRKSWEHWCPVTDTVGRDRWSAFLSICPLTDQDPWCIPGPGSWSDLEWVSLSLGLGESAPCSPPNIRHPREGASRALAASLATENALPSSVRGPELCGLPSSSPTPRAVPSPFRKQA